MWRKPEDPKPASPAAEVPPPVRRVEPPPAVRSVAGLTAEVVQPSGGVITSSLLIKGEIKGGEDLYIDGEVQGTIALSDGRVTVGPHGTVSADMDAREIIIRGKVKGGVRGRERVEIGRTGEVRGDIVTVQIVIEEGAQIHSKVEITRSENSLGTRPWANATGTASGVLQPAVMKAAGDVTN